MKLVLIALATVLTAGAASAENNRVSTGNNVGTGNVGFANGNFNSNGNAASTARGGNASGGSVTNSNTYKNRVPGAIGAPGLAAGANTCAGSFSLGVSAAAGGFGGIGFGKTYEMRNCEARVAAEQIYRYGYRQQAIQLLLNEHPMVRRAFATAPQQQVVYRKKRK
jgi:hypothetical protein